MGRVLLFRKAILTVTGSRLVKGFVTTYGMRLGAGRFVAAESLEGTVDKVKELNERGLAATLDYLGESVDSREMAAEAAEVVLRTLEAIHAHRLDSNVSVKLTQLGLLLDEEYCMELMDRIVGRARELGNFVRIDMEDSSVTEVTLQIYERLRDRHGGDHVGVVIQSYLYRTARDRKRLEKLDANLRIVKGAYSEPGDVAFTDKKQVDKQYIALAEAHLRAGCYTAIATHDRKIIERLKKVKRTGSGKPVRCEYQMLYGIAEDLQDELRKEGYKVRVYTPFGEQWYAYFTRRIAERPANLFFVMRGMLGRRRRSG
ncbi:proline dehydrogenase family protein [Paenibacillus tarimensis]|uniref:proline dehydrogenase family protein n=1 Tax=Paenibacillus tarimensis TaxID=416012 RepID=UPI001F3B59AC|nr:proline dehydrogenase family protein [Paenibacillus tarimensis]MCF2945712.1 proline dehydrogenase family protein [Paenibacillus tarimensis]